MKLRKNKKFTTLKKVILIINCLLGILLGIPNRLDCQLEGIKYIRNYTPREYDHLSQNFGIVQAKSGIIYVANNGGLLEYDGESWRVLGIPGYAPVRSLAIDENDTIYIGGINQIGYFEPGPKGSLSYISLLPFLKEEERNFSVVWSTQVTPHGIYFRTRNIIFRWNPKTKVMKRWNRKNSLRPSFVVGSDYYVLEKNVGLLKQVGEELQLISGSEIFATARLYLIAPFKNNPKQLIIATRSMGFYLYDGNSFQPFTTQVADYIRDNQLYNSTLLSSGDYALGTLRGGVVIMSPGGNLKKFIDQEYGLLDNAVYNLFEDKQGNLWLCLSKGISKIEYHSPLSFYNQKTGLTGIVLSVIKHRKNIYAGTTSGLFKYDSSSKFRLVDQLSLPCWDLLSTENSLIVATTNGVYQVKNSLARQIHRMRTFSLLMPRKPQGIIWCGTSNGLVALSEQNGEWKAQASPITLTQEIRSIACIDNGNLWLGTVNGGVFLINMSKGFTQPEIKNFNETNGLPAGEITASTLKGKVVFATQKGLFRFDKNTQTFVPDLTLGANFAGEEASKPVFRIVEDSENHIWFHSESRNYHAIPQPGGFYIIDAVPFRRLPLTAQVNSIYPDPDGKIIWFASQEGLIRYDSTFKKNYSRKFDTLIRRVTLNKDQRNENSIYEGCDFQHEKAVIENIPEIQYKDRNVHFQFAAPFFEGEKETTYQFLLENYDSEWSNWISENQRNYSNLSSGTYTFRVRAKNIYGTMGKEKEFRFLILGPWYQAWWAYLLYIVIIFLVTYLVSKWRHSIRLQREKEKLEVLVKERTKEIQNKNIQLREQSEKLKELDQVKSRFFTNISHEFRTPLTLIMSPLEQMKQEIGSTRHKRKITVMLRSSQRLLTLINQLLDLARIDSGKMKLQVNCRNIVTYLEQIVASFQLLSHQNKLNLEFTSKETDIPLYFDARKIEEVIYNLLINAIKFTKPGGTISVSVSKEQRTSSVTGGQSKDFVKISVKDSGIGISREQLNYIFDRFYQADTAEKQTSKGTGIGLSLAREIVLLHHGTLDVHSQKQVGTEFVIMLPMGNAHFQLEEMTDVTSTPVAIEFHRAKELETLYQTMDEENEEEEVQDQGENVSSDKDDDQTKPVILVVEDEADVRRFICEPLESHFTVVEATDGRQGVEKAQEIQPDLVISDIMMPGLNGFQLCQQLKNDIKTSHIPIILLTAKASEASRLEGLKTGADDYITKPFNGDVLLARIRNLIDLRQQLHLKYKREVLLLPSQASVSSLDEQFLVQFRNTIEENLTDPDFNVDTIYEKLNIPRSTFYKKIKALTGEGPNQFIQDYRLERGAQLLRENYGNITEVTMAIGFSNSAYFAKCFKKKYKMSPTSYQVSESQTPKN